MGVARDLVMGFYPGVMARLGLGREAVEASGEMGDLSIDSIPRHVGS